MTPLEPHPYALIIRRHNEAEKKEMSASLKRHGLIYPIMVYEGKTLDGVGRETICCKLNIPVRYEQFKPTELVSALDYVRIQNLERRQLTAGQRAIAARVWCDEKAKEAYANRNAGNFKNGTIKKSDIKSREKAAKDFKVSGGAIFQVGWLQRNCPSAIKKVNEGEPLMTIYEKERKKIDPNYASRKQKYILKHYYEAPERKYVGQEEVRNVLKKNSDLEPLVPNGLTSFSSPNEAVRYMQDLFERGYEINIHGNKFGYEATIVQNPFPKQNIRCSTWIHAVASALKRVPFNSTLVAI